ncbi:MAG: sulfatase-like hydrolase/transferase [Verrucomicrobia bacterium]|nr:sulfatase-like hydrolase/transferase [Verrucomicrobiota bacterium]
MPPNIILICSDQHRADRIGAYGSRVCQTPNLDRLASEGVPFTRCYSQNPVCSASRSTIMTGWLSRNHRVLTNGPSLSRSIPTVADSLHGAGYRTAAFGKMHLTPHSAGAPQAPHYGFEHLECAEDSRIGPYLDWAIRTFPDYEGYLIGTLFNLPKEEAYWKGRRDFRKEYLQAREKFVKPLEISHTCNWGFGHYSPLPEAAHPNTWITNRAIAHLEAHDSKTPLLMWVSYVDPHNPFDPPKRFREMYRPEDVEACIGVDADESLLPPHTRAVRKYFKDFTEQDHRILRALYYGSITFMDEQIGRFLKALEQKLDMHNTLIVYLSDHGELLGDYGIYGKTAYHYDPCIRVPMIFRWSARWTAGRRESAIMELTDLAPTLLDAAGMKANTPMDGVSFAELLDGRANAPPRDHAFIESYAGAPEDPTPAPLTWAKTIRSSRWRATFYPGASHGELFDMESDPHELHNLWLDPKCREVIEEHRKLLLDRLMLADYPVRRLY